MINRTIVLYKEFIYIKNNIDLYDYFYYDDRVQYFQILIR